MILNRKIAIQSIEFMIKAQIDLTHNTLILKIMRDLKGN